MEKKYYGLSQIKEKFVDAAYRTIDKIMRGHGFKLNDNDRQILNDELEGASKDICRELGLKDKMIDTLDLENTNNVRVIARHHIRKR